MKNRVNYPENWEDTIRPDILKRDNYSCKRCRTKHRQVGYYNGKGVFTECDEFMQTWAKANGFKVVKIHLQIAHLDQDSSNNSYDNLQAMCPKCHLQYDMAFNMAKRRMNRNRSRKN